MFYNASQLLIFQQNGSAKSSNQLAEMLMMGRKAILSNIEKNSFVTKKGREFKIE
jgi:biotin operon repressor